MITEVIRNVLYATSSSTHKNDFVYCVADDLVRLFSIKTLGRLNANIAGAWRPRRHTSGVDEKQLNICLIHFTVIQQQI